MKKHFLAVLAVLVAVGLSAYTSVHKAAKKPTTQTPYFWYEFNAATGKVSSTVLNPDAQDIKDNVMEGGSNELTPCSDLTAIICLAGSTSSTLQPGNTPDPETSSHDNRIRED